MSILNRVLRITKILRLKIKKGPNLGPFSIALLILGSHMIQAKKLILIFVIYYLFLAILMENQHL
jgi:hypothetical protein